MTTMSTQKQSQSAAATMVQASPALADFEVSPGMAEMLADMEAKGNDPGNLSEKQRAAYVHDICRMLRLNPLTRPAQFVKLNGKWVLYLTRTATDQLAARYSLNRKTIVQPCIVDIGGTKVAMCVVEVTLPNGRSETATATLPVVDHTQLYMKVETKAKRRATLSILGLGVLSEDEAEDASDAAAQGPRKVNERPLFAPSTTPPQGSPVAPAPETASASPDPAIGSAATSIINGYNRCTDAVLMAELKTERMATWKRLAEHEKAAVRDAAEKAKARIESAAKAPAERSDADDSAPPDIAADDAAHANYVKDAEAWRAHLESKDSPHAVAGAYHKRSGAFDRKGVRMSRRDAAVTVIAMKSSGDLASASAFLDNYPKRGKATGAQTGEGA